ncbi:MAG TPA: TonB-dependent receptor [Bryobacteraceae bacterium]|nr:TonB-dependent receptor [Bryobacteraceae bacterium]
MFDRRWIRLPILALLLVAAGSAAESQGTVSGKVSLEVNGDPVHGATVLLVQLGRKTTTDDQGRYEFRGVPAGRYTVLAHMHPLSDQRQTVAVAPNETGSADFRLTLAAVREEITVTASGREESTFDAFQTVSSTHGLDLAPRAAASLGEALEHEPGIAKRSFGPGTSRPVVRGFDGDRVLILQDGMPTGTLSAQSGDHGEPFDASNLDSVEVVRGPATLLYGTNAIGGVVNAITDHHLMHEHAHPGTRGFLNGSGGSANALGGANGGFDVGIGKWTLTGRGGGLRTGDYSTPIGTVPNSHTRIEHSSGGVARHGQRGFFYVGYGISRGRYGIPEIQALDGEGPIDEDWRLHNVRFSGGMKTPAAGLDLVTLNLNYSDWRHKEIVEEQPKTRFFNKVFSYRGVVQQRRKGILSGSFGFSGVRRSYDVKGEEALTPAVDQTSFGAFAVEELNLERVRFQLGGRVETNRYSPAGLRERRFTGFSGSAGSSVRLWNGGALVGSYTNSYRAPALEELYNLGPHPGNLAYEVGDPDLFRERSDGVDLSLRHAAQRVRAEANFFHYRSRDYVYMARMNVIQDGFVVAHYQQGDARYQGAEARLDVSLRNDLWLNLGVDSVRAELRNPVLPLPRIPPVRGRIGFDARYKGLSVRPELVLAGAQERLYTNETRTAGYGVMNLLATYTIVQPHVLHSISANLFNAGDNLYRNHVSLIKQWAPEIGRGIRFSYSVRFF